MNTGASDMRRVAWFAAFAAIASPSLSLAADMAEDDRMAIALTPAEYEYILGNMRQHLIDVQIVVGALAAGDSARASKAATNLGTEGFTHSQKRPPGLLEKLPKDFSQLIADFHRQFDVLAEGIASGESSTRSLQLLGTAMQNCVACHATYRIVTSDR